MKTKADATTTTEAAAVAEQGAQTAPKQAASKGKASKKKGAPTGQKTAGKPAASKKAAKATAKKEAKRASKNSVPREFSKKNIVLDLLRRKDGATMAEIAKATDWQNHSIRGFISGNLTKKMGLAVESSKNEAGERTYRIAK